MPDNSQPGSSAADLLQQMFAASSSSRPNSSGQEPNLLQSMASIGASLKRQVREASEEFRRHMSEVRRKAPSMNVVARPATDIMWTQTPEAQRRIQALENAGFVREGVFEFAAIPNYATMSFCHPGRATAAFVSKTSKGITLEFETRYSDGAIFELCDSQPPAGLFYPPWMTRRFHPERSPEELMESHERERPLGPAVPLDSGQAIHWVEEGFGRIQAWRSDRGGWNRDEIRRQRGWVGQEETEERREQLELARHENLERWLFNWLRIQPGLRFDPASVIDTLTIVSDDLTADMLMMVWSAGTGDFDIGRGRFEGAHPRAEFAALNTERGEPLVRVWQKTTVPAADFYLRPEKPRRVASRTPVGEALNEGLIRGDLRRALMAVAGEEIQSAEDARAIVDTLVQLKPSETRDLSRQVQAVARLFSQAKNRLSEAYPILKEEGILQLVRFYDSILTSDPEESGDILLMLLRVLVRFESEEGTNRVIAAARRPLNPEGMAWGAVLKAFTADHPQRARVFAELSSPLPVEPIALALLDAANASREAGETLGHPFESAAGRSRLEQWLKDSNPEYSSCAHSAVSALRYLQESEALFTLALHHPDPEVRLSAAGVRAELGRSDGFEVLVEGCGHWSTAALSKETLTELGHGDLIPPAAKAPDFSALAEMCAWLAHPNELARIPDELEIMDHRSLRWPPTGEEKPFWLIRYRARALEHGEPDDTGWGLVGSVTFCLFSYGLHEGSIEDAYAVHCFWEMSQSDWIELEELEDGAEESEEHRALLAHWTGEPLASALVVQVARLSADLGISEPVIGLARVSREDGDGWVVLDGARSKWIRSAGDDDDGRLLLMRHIGRRLLGLDCPASALEPEDQRRARS